MKSPAEKTKKQIRPARLLAWTFGILSALLLVVLSITLFLPAAVESKVNSILNRLSEKAEMEFYLRSVRLSNANLGCLIYHTTQDGRKQLVAEVSSLDISYRSWDLLRGRIDRIQASGVTIPVSIAENEMHVPLLDWMSSLKTETPGAEASDGGSGKAPVADLNAVIPVKLGEISVRGNLVIQSDSDFVFLPCMFSVETAGKTDWNDIKFRAHVAHSSNRVRAEGRYRHLTHLLALDMETTLASRSMPYFVREKLPRRFHTDLTAKVQTELDLQKKRMSPDSVFELKTKLQASGKAWRLRSEPVISIHRTEKDGLRLQVDGIQGELDGLDAEVRNFYAETDSAFTALDGGMDLSLGSEFMIPLSFAAKREEKTLDVQLTTRTQEIAGKQQALRKNEMKIAFFEPNLTAHAVLGESVSANASFLLARAEAVLPGVEQVRFEKAELTAEVETQPASSSVSASVNLAADNVKAAANGSELSIPSVSFIGNAAMPIPAADEAPASDTQPSAAEDTEPVEAEKFQIPASLSANGVLFLSGAKASGFGAEMLLPAMTISAAAKDGCLTGDFSLKDASARMQKKPFAAEGIHANIPFVFPAASEPKKGKLTVASILWNKQKAGSLQAETELNKLILSLRGNGSFPVQTADFSCSAGLDDTGFAAEVKLTVPEQEIQENAGLSGLVPAMHGYSFSGKIAAEAEYEIRHGEQNGACQVLFSDGAVSNSDLGLAVKGLHLDFAMDELPRLSSRSGQSLSFDSLDYSNFHMDQGTALFRMDAPADWSIENLSLKWCRGVVRLAAVRFSPETAKLPVTLYCDRLELPEFLRQTGLGPIQGTGQISGTIPVIYQKGNLVFQDGFLFSTPGEEGVIRGGFDESLTKDMGPEMALAMDALKEFTYSWVKTKLSTTEAGLNVRLEFDGKPANLLYYEFNQNSGSFIPSKIPHRFQGIHLDVNVNIPLESLMRLVNNIKNIFSQ